MTFVTIAYIIDFFVGGGGDGAFYTRSTIKPISDATVAEMLVKEGFSFNCGPPSHESVLLCDKEGLSGLKVVSI